MKYRIESDDKRHQRQGPPGVIGTARNFRGYRSPIEPKATQSSKLTTAAKDQKRKQYNFKSIFGNQTREGN